jgi:hypothetical protein
VHSWTPTNALNPRSGCALGPLLAKEYDVPFSAQIARDLSMTESAVLQAKFRVLKRLREEFADLLD